MSQDMLDYLARESFGVLATSGPGGQPHTSLMSYVSAQGGRLLYMLTLAGTRKHDNLCRNPQVSLLVDNRGSHSDAAALQALSVTGQAEELNEPGERDQALERLLERHPQLAPLAARPECRVIKLTPRRLQLLSGPLQAQVAEL